MKSLLLLVSISTLLASTSWARDYYVSPQGNDAADGATPATAFQSLGRINLLKLQPGDSVHLQAGATFAGRLTFDRDDSGTAAQPVTVSSYLTGPVSPTAAKAKLVSTEGDAIEIKDTSYLHIQDLEISGQATPASDKVDGNGITALSATAGYRPADLKISGVTISGFTGDTNSWERTGNCIYVDSVDEGPGFEGVTVLDSELSECDHSGITTEEHGADRHHGVLVQRVVAHDNHGTEDSAQYSGSGIVISGVMGGQVLDSEAYNNGDRNHRDGGPVGIWAWNADSVRIANCKSHNNHTSGGSDGGGFDFDGGVTNSIIENNVSHDNDGAGYMLCTYSGADPVANNIVRNNKSTNDGQKNGYGALVILGDIRDSVYENNDVTVDAPGKDLKAIWYWFWAGSNVVVRNNKFTIGQGAHLMTMTWWDTSAVIPVLVQQNEITYSQQKQLAPREVNIEFGDPELQRKAQSFKTPDDWMKKANQPGAFHMAQ